MPMDLSATNIIDMIDRLYHGRRTVSKDEIVAEARGADIGRDGLRIVGALPPGEYTKDQLTEAVSNALVGVGSHTAERR
jgi:hypothetical protein